VHALQNLARTYPKAAARAEWHFWHSSHFFLSFYIPLVSMSGESKLKIQMEWQVWQELDLTLKNLDFLAAYFL